MIQPEGNSKNLLGITRAKAKMYEYDVPIEDHIDISAISLTGLIDLTIGMLGELTSGGQNLDEERQKLIFSARYFDSLISTNTIEYGIDYLRLLAAASYYLASYPGSSKVIARVVNVESLTPYSLLARILFAVLSRKKINSDDFTSYEFITELNPFILDWNLFLKNGTSFNDSVVVLRKKIYADGSDRDLLVVDILCFVTKKIIDSSSFKLLPQYSDLSFEIWKPYLSESLSIKELWPSQILLGENGVFRGASAVIQMPTSAGKTRASEIVIRSSFLSGRSTLTVIIAPFRALCQEIYDELVLQFKYDSDVSINIVSDVMQEDLIDIPENNKGILVLTPEKFDYILRHDDEISQKIGLIIYDEGHLFDDITRGLKYELLLASLKSQLSPTTQILLISAVMSNSQEIKDWLLGDRGILIEGKNLNPTSRNIAFSSWGRDLRGRLNFVDEENAEESLFFVPRVLESQELQLKPGERTRRNFPAKDNRSHLYNSNHVAMYLGCKLSNQGLTAVFTGRKDSALVIARDLVDAYDRGLTVTSPVTYSENLSEAEKLISYIERVLGTDSTQAKAARLGTLIHHGSTPHGLRLAIEFALQKLHFKSVICTSTLAQGVNLPIRYLIVSTSRQGGGDIKVRDFHNLMGRAGRSGFYTEGTVIFSDPKIYDQRVSNSWYWNKAKQLIDARNSESCKSRLLNIFIAEPQEEDDRALWLDEQSAIREEANSYLLSALADIEEQTELPELITDLVKNTLAYFQATEVEKPQLISFFMEIGLAILNEEPSAIKRKIFARSILSLSQSRDLLLFLDRESPSLETSEDELDLLRQLWSFIYEHSRNKILKSFSQEDSFELCKRWLNGDSFSSIYEYGETLNFNNTRSLTLDKIVDLCEGCFGYDVSLIIGSMSEIYVLVQSEEENIKQVQSALYGIQKSIKYGLPTLFSIFIYELGLSDRQLSIDIAERIDEKQISYSRSNFIDEIENNQELRDMISISYPSYFSEKINQLIDSRIPF